MPKRKIPRKTEEPAMPEKGNINNNPQEPRRIVAKFGTAILTLPNGRLNEELIRRWVAVLADLRDQGNSILIVTSGAVGAGVGELNLEKRPEDLPDEQAVAAVGQSLLMAVYGDAFRRRGYHVAQILLTRSDLDDRRRHLNIRNCLRRLLDMGIVPIVNENDTVAVAELRVGDNDTLAAIIASKAEADLLALMTDVDGLYESDPRSDPEARVIERVESITPQLEAMAGRTTSAMGIGGMRSKIRCAQAAMRAGIPVTIANGRDPENLRRILNNQPVGTKFIPPETSRLSARDRWIALGAHTAERRLTVDPGARQALVVHKKSLLPAGIVSVEGEFDKGDVVEIRNEDGRCFAKGLSNYSSQEVEKIRGRQTTEIESILGERLYDEIIHRDNMVVLDVT
jgi:glutamate 5-kinase